MAHESGFASRSCTTEKASRGKAPYGNFLIRDSESSVMTASLQASKRASPWLYRTREDPSRFQSMPQSWAGPTRKRPVETLPRPMRPRGRASGTSWNRVETTRIATEPAQRSFLPTSGRIDRAAHSLFCFEVLGHQGISAFVVCW